MVDEEKIRSNLEVLRDIADRSGARLLLALKAFSMWSLSGLIQEYLDGCCASGLWEAKLARGKGLAEKSMSKILSTYSPLIGREKLMKFVLCLIILFLIIRNRMELNRQRGQVFRLVCD